MSKGIPLDWLKHLDTEKKKEDMKQTLYTSLVTKRLKEIIIERENSLDKSETTLSDYESPSWSHKQADRNGYRRCLREFRDLVNFIEE